MMIDAIVVGTATSGGDDAESALARCLFERAMGSWPAPHRVRCAQSITALAEIAPGLLPPGMPADAKILLLAHDRLLPAPGCIEILAQALDGGLCSAAACDASGCGGADYLTLRGFERFAASRRAAASHPPANANAPPRMLLARLDALADGSWRRAPRVGGAWAHDFSGYRAHRREEILGLLSSSCASLLDVGGGTGGFLAAVKERLPACQTALVELSPSACADAADHADRIWQGDFLAVPIEARFACVSFLDVLEHVAEPLAMLAKARGLLEPEGCVITSIPNVGHWSIIADLLEGRWDYAPAGILCVTHLRFFTRRSIEELFFSAGFVIERWQAEHMPPPPWFDPGAMHKTLTMDHESLSTVAWHCRARSA